MPAKTALVQVEGLQHLKEAPRPGLRAGMGEPTVDYHNHDFCRFKIESPQRQIRRLDTVERGYPEPFVSAQNPGCSCVVA